MYKRKVINIFLTKNMEMFIQNFHVNKKLINCIKYVFLLGLIGNLYGFINYSPTNDSTMIVNIENNWNIALGRFFIPCYLSLRLPVTIPWIIGLISLLFISIACYCICESLDIYSSPAIFAIAGFLTINISLGDNIAAYLHTVDLYMLAFLLSCIGLFVLSKNKKWAIPLATICWALSLGIYQAYIGAAIGGILLVCIKKLLYKNSWKEIASFVEKATISFVFSGVLYIILVKIFQILYHISTVDTQNGLLQLLHHNIFEILLFIPRGYKNFIQNLSYGGNVKDQISCVGMLVIGVVVLLIIKVSLFRRFISILLLGLFPIGINIAYILSMGTSDHMLMRYSYELFWVAIIVIVDVAIKENFNVLMIVFLGGCVILHLSFNLILINGAYIERKFVYESSNILINEILRDVNSVPEYQEGSTPVILLGNFEKSYLNGKRIGLTQYSGWTGFSGSAVTYPATFKHFSQNILGHDVNLVFLSEDEKNFYEKQTWAEELPTYPQEGYYKIVDNIMFIKLSELH